MENAWFSYLYICTRQKKGKLIANALVRLPLFPAGETGPPVRFVSRLLRGLLITSTAVGFIRLGEHKRKINEMGLVTIPFPALWDFRFPSLSPPGSGHSSQTEPSTPSLSRRELAEEEIPPPVLPNENVITVFAG